MMVESKRANDDLENFLDEEELTLKLPSRTLFQNPEQQPSVLVNAIPKRLTEGHAVQLIPTDSSQLTLGRGILAEPISIGNSIRFFPKERRLRSQPVSEIRRFGNHESPDRYLIRTDSKSTYALNLQLNEGLLPISDLAFNRDFPFRLNRVDAPQSTFPYRFMDDYVPASFFKNSFVVFQVVPSHRQKSLPSRHAVDGNMTVFRVQGDLSASSLRQRSFLNFDFDRSRYASSDLVHLRAESDVVRTIRSIHDYDSPSGTPIYRIEDASGQVLYLVGEKSFRAEWISTRILDFADRVSDRVVALIRLAKL